MTPGPIAVNSATYVGYMTAGVFGSMVATAGVTLPSLLLILLVAGFVSRYQKHPLYTMVFYGLRPVCRRPDRIRSRLYRQNRPGPPCRRAALRDWFATLFSKPLDAIQPAALLIFAATLVVHHKFKLHPLILILGAGVAGILLQLIF